MSSILPPTPSSGDTAAEAFAQELDTVVQLLQAANAMPELVDPGLLAEMLGALQTSAGGNWPGVPELLRSWRLALMDLARSGSGFGADDLVPATLWFASLQEHVAGRLDADGRAMLARLPDSIRWLPRLSPAFANGIARRLDTYATELANIPADAAPALEEIGPGGSDAHAATFAAEDTSNDALDAPGEPPTATDAETFVFATNDTPTFLDTVAEPVIPAPTRADPDLSAFDMCRVDMPSMGMPSMPTPSTGHAETEVASLIGAETAADIAAETAFADPPVQDDDTDAFAFEATEEQAFAFAPDLAPAPMPPLAIVQGTTSIDMPADVPTDHYHDMGVMGTPAVLSADDAVPAKASLHPPTAQSDDTTFDFDFAIGAGVDGAAASDADTGPIWIGQEELDLTRQAIAEQLLPLAQAWSDTTEPDAAAALIGELSYQIQLVGNVLELIGTYALARGMEAVREGAESGDPAVSPDTVATWCSVLLAVMAAPDEASADVLVMAADGLPGLDADWADALHTEMARVRIGFDPSLIAARKTLAEPEDMQLSPADDVAPSVLEGMLRELPGNAERLGAAVRALAESRAFEPIDEARRVAHTIKGDANTVGVRGLANLTHSLEDILVALVKHPELLDEDLATLLVDAGDCVEEMADHLLGRGPASAGAPALYQRVLDAANAVTEGGSGGVRSAPSGADTHADQPAAGIVQADAIGEPSARDDTQAQAATSPQAATDQTLSVASTLLDELQRLTGEGMVTTRQIDQQLDSLAGLHRDQRIGLRNTQDLMARLDDMLALRGAALQSAAQQAGADIDPLELDQYNELHIISRQLLEAQADSTEFVRRIGRTLSALDELRNQQEQLNRELQRTLLRTRTVPFVQISARLQRIVRQTSRQVGKTVALEIVGEQIPVDAELLERVVEPLAHLLRNAIDHGIEPAEARHAAGKPETGTIRLQVGLQGDSATIDIHDDGRGLNFAAIHARAQDMGLIESGLFGDDQAALDERALTRLILLPGFSTRDTATDVSGRGIGMDVVNQRVVALRGSMSITSEIGKGTRISLRLPITRTLANVIVARGQRQVSAIVASSVERVVSLAPGDCRMDPEHGLQARVDEAWLPALPVEALYDDPADLSGWLAGGGIGLLAADTDGRRQVVLVQAVDEVRSVVVKPISAKLPPIPAVRGITQLGDGGLAPVLDLDQLLQTIAIQNIDLDALSLPPAAHVARVVVADDSLSVRRALEQLMQDAGFEVATARDGFEALAAIQAKPTHALLVDLEMPRMNGLEVTRSLRNHDETRTLPVVMITSRATDRHQAMATEAGVTRMLGKPFSEDSLVALVRELVAG